MTEREKQLMLHVMNESMVTKKPVRLPSGPYSLVQRGLLERKDGGYSLTTFGWTQIGNGCASSRRVSEGR
jgi:hypothetical protein